MVKLTLTEVQLTAGGDEMLKIEEVVARYERQGMPHTIQGVVCIGCEIEWVAVYPSDVPIHELWCPMCGPGTIIEDD